MNPFRPSFKLAVILLACSGVLACTCAAYDVDVGYLWGAFRRVVGLRPRPPPRTETIVIAGQELRVEGQTRTLRDIPPDAVTERLAWAGIRLQDGWLAFEGQTLETVVAEFNRHNGVQLSIGDMATGQLRVGGKCRITDVAGFVSALARTNGVKAVSVPATGKHPEMIVLTGGSAAGSAVPEAPTESTEE